MGVVGGGPKSLCLKVYVLCLSPNKKVPLSGNPKSLFPSKRVIFSPGHLSVAIPSAKANGIAILMPERCFGMLRRESGTKTRGF